MVDRQRSHSQTAPPFDKLRTGRVTQGESVPSELTGESVNRGNGEASLTVSPRPRVSVSGAFSALSNHESPFDRLRAGDLRIRAFFWQFPSSDKICHQLFSVTIHSIETDNQDLILSKEQMHIVTKM